MRIYVIEMDGKEFRELQEVQELKGVQACPVCHGSGKQKTIGPDQSRDDGRMCYYVSECPACKGIGIIQKEK